MIHPILSPSLSSTSLRTANSAHNVTKSLSTSSAQSLSGPINASSSSSSLGSIQFAPGEVEVVKEEGLKHAMVTLEARKYKFTFFASQLLECLRVLQINTWLHPDIRSHDIVIHKVSGSLTNAVFFVSCPAVVGVRTVLLRIYGPSSGSLISRPHELHTLHILSSQYRIGPRVFGTFENGRVEEYFESTTLTPGDIRNPEISRWIGARMAELHSVDVEVVEDTTIATSREGKRWEIGAKRNVKSWLGPAEQVLALPAISDAVRMELNLPYFKEKWDRYMQWLQKVDDVRHGSRRVFAHNDTQYGNLLRLKHPKSGVNDHRQIIVVDFEYASPNPASFDIANHFHEWTANYHSNVPHILDAARYPTLAERRNFYTAYLTHSNILGEKPPFQEDELEGLISELDRQVCIWSPASHAMWAIWGIVQAREDLEGNTEPEFDYISYSQGRMASFLLAIKDLGV